MKTFVQRGGVWVISQMLLLGAIGCTGILFRSESRSTTVTAAGGFLLLIGGGFALAGALSLGRGLTPCLSPSGEPKLVCTGAYSKVRHPIYTSLMMAGFGWALFWQSWPAFLMATLLIPFFNAKAAREEQWLTRHVPAYDDYAKRVRRFIPRIY